MLSYISNTANYKEVLSRVKSVKHTLWTGTADIKDLTSAGFGMKGEDKRNFEAGILTDDPAIVEQAMNQFDCGLVSTARSVSVESFV